MPAIKSINLSDGISIVGSSLQSVSLSGTAMESMAGSLTIEEAGETLSNYFQQQYELWIDVDTLPADDRTKIKPNPTLLSTERIEKITGTTYLVIIQMYIAVHVFSVSPLTYTVRCSDFPIGGDWWL